MAAAFGQLHLAPAVFWSMTLPELSAALRILSDQAAIAEPLAPAGLRHLMQRYPDQSNEGQTLRV